MATSSRSDARLNSTTPEDSGKTLCDVQVGRGGGETGVRRRGRKGVMNVGCCEVFEGEGRRKKSGKENAGQV